MDKPKFYTLEDCIEYVRKEKETMLNASVKYADQKADREQFEHEAKMLGRIEENLVAFRAVCEGVKDILLELPSNQPGEEVVNG